MESWGVGVVICLERCAECLHMVHICHPETPSSLASFNPDWLTFLVPAYPGCAGKEAVKWV